MHDEDAFKRILASEKGAIWVSAHFGLWEIFAMYAGMRDAHLTSVYRPVKNPWIDKAIRRQRAAIGQELVERKGALRALLRALRKESGHVAMLADQHTRRDGIWVPFFGRLAATTPAPALLALRTGAPIIVWYSRRLPGTFHFGAWCDKPLFVAPSGDRAADIERITREISNRIEKFVRKAPAQWLWFHRRWRTPPAETIEKEHAHVHAPLETA